MSTLSLKVINKDADILAENTETNEAMLVYKREYAQGDKIVLTSSEKDIFLMVQVDDALGKALVYITKNDIFYIVPFGPMRLAYSPKAFYGSLHLLTARLATKEEVDTYKNLAINVMDQHGDTGCFPHAEANVETRGEAVFAARNAIDGICETHSHGNWPYQSWGINRQDDASMKVNFGRNVVVDKIVLYTRADFPHDNWWERVTATFSQGNRFTFELKKSDKPHVLNIQQVETEWVQLSELIKAEDPSPFPALTEIEVYGREKSGYC